jgi:site-specific DNA-methyltransferase (adenine-specific)
MKIDLRLGDCLEVLKTISDNSIDSVITDPPYHLTTNTSSSKGFMGKEWDGGDIAFRTDVWSECLRVLKPGGHLLAFSHSRTYHRMAVAVEDAGFEIRDQILWIYGSGFPKSHNIGKAIDKIEGNDREVVGHNPNHRNTESDVIPLGFQGGRSDGTITKGNSEWEGWGTALKPAHEPIVMARKPLTEKSIAENVLKYGTGGINIDGSRVGTDDTRSKASLTALGQNSGWNAHNNKEVIAGSECGRFPANIIFDEEAGQLLDEQSGPTSQGHWSKTKTTGFGEFGNGKSEYKGVGPKDKNKDKGGASRFFYCPKASKKDRNEGLDAFEEKVSTKQFMLGLSGITHSDGSVIQNAAILNKNNHPTVKPTDLMRYLINLITPPNGTTLDPFMGSGSTGKAAVRCGVNFIGIEKEQEYMDIASARIQHEQNKPLQTKLF